MRVVGQWSVRWLKRGQPCLHHLHVLHTAFPGGLSFRLAFGSFFKPLPSSPALFFSDKSVCQVPGPISVGAHGWKARVYQGITCSRRSVSRVRCSDGGERV